MKPAIDQNEDFLVIQDVIKEFQSSSKDSRPIRVIDGISVALKAGEFAVFLGPSGCGKTTLMRMAGGLDHPTSGEVRLAGEVVTGPDRRKGMVFQGYSSFPWLTVLGNIRFGLRYRRDVDAAEKDRIARHYLKLVELEDFADFFTNRISGGMRQRVAIARTLAAGPDILLMDEPFGALDAQTREFLQVQLLEIARAEGKTVIFVTHDVEEAVFLADRIFMFSARPASIIEEIDVTGALGPSRKLETKQQQDFFRIRNHVLDLMRVQARKTDETFRPGIVGE